MARSFDPLDFKQAVALSTKSPLSRSRRLPISKKETELLAARLTAVRFIEAGGANPGEKARCRLCPPQAIPKLILE